MDRQRRATFLGGLAANWVLLHGKPLKIAPDLCANRAGTAASVCACTDMSLSGRLVRRAEALHMFTVYYVQQQWTAASQSAASLTTWARRSLVRLPLLSLGHFASERSSGYPLNA